MDGGMPSSPFPGSQLQAFFRFRQDFLQYISAFSERQNIGDSGMKVYLIGAGPGDPGLLTLRGRDILAAADVVIYDYLASDELLAHTRPDAERIYVGKIAGNHALPQPQINELLIAKAREGKEVARLKGGDPYIFGRGGEEAEALLKAGIPFEEVPGISSVIAGPAYAGIPLTHRAFASSVTIITGHEDPTKPESAHNWKALAASASTLVFVMGMKNLAQISSKLMEAGLAGDTPAALVTWATTPRHRSCVCTLATLPKAAEEGGFKNPSLIVVGKVATLHDSLNWFEQKPLLGRSVVVTRAREQASGLATRLSALGAEVIQFPTIAFHSLADTAEVDSAARSLSGYDWVVFTSVNGVRFFMERLNALGLDARAFAGCRVAAIGPATAKAVKETGIIPDFVPESYVAESVAQGLVAQGIAGKKVLIPRARQAREVLPEELRKAGAEVLVLPVYETVPDTGNKEAVLERLEEGTLSAVTFGSSSTVENFFASIPEELVRRHPETALCVIGPVTAGTLKKHGFEPTVQPEAFTIPALVEAMKEHFTKK